jgi:hypothetical protein
MQVKKLTKIQLRISNALWRARKQLHHTWQWIRFGDITEKVVDFAGDHVVAEVEYRGRGGKLVGYWAYGYFDPAMPYQGGMAPRKLPKAAANQDWLSEDLA